MAYVGKVNDSERLYSDIVAAKKKNRTDKTSLELEDYLSLIVAEMQSQDILNPNTDTSAMVNQLVSMTTVQAMQNMVKSTNAQYSAGLVGKNVVVADYDENGKYFQESGKVESVIMAGDEPKFVVNGKQYALSNIMEVSEQPTEVE